MDSKEIDKLVASKVFGYPIAECEVLEYTDSGDYFVKRWRMRTDTYPGGFCNFFGEVFEYQEGEVWEDIPEYSTDMNAAYKIIDYMRCYWDMYSFEESWEIKLWRPIGPFADKSVYVEDKSAAVCICKAALKMIGVDIENN